jgi:mycothiol S-conjugate amidase
MRGYDPADVDPLLEDLAFTIDEIHESLQQLEAFAANPPATAPPIHPDDVASLAALIHVGRAAQRARSIIEEARQQSGLRRVPDRDETPNERRARHLIYAPRREALAGATTLEPMAERLCLLTVHAHPDDESSKGAGTVAKYHAQGVHTVLVCCTGGEEGDILNPAMDTDEVKADIGAVRRAELDNAARIIGYDEVVMLGYRDSGMADSEANKNPNCFAQAPLDEAVGRLVAVIRRTRPQVVVTYHEKQERYPHPDHLRVHEVTMAAVDAAADASRYPEAGEPWEVQKIYYTAWSFKRIVLMHEKFLELGLESPFDENWFKDRQPDEGESDLTTQISLEGFANVRQEALLAHATQIDPNSKFWFGLPPEVMETIHPYDDYVLARGPRGEGELETDIFAGITVNA